ncbi:hypothetical protein ACFL59_06455 [Planctomycetota bacterium]
MKLNPVDLGIGMALLVILISGALWWLWRSREQEPGIYCGSIVYPYEGEWFVIEDVREEGTATLLMSRTVIVDCSTNVIHTLGCPAPGGEQIRFGRMSAAAEAGYTDRHGCLKRGGDTPPSGATGGDILQWRLDQGGTVLARGRSHQLLVSRGGTATQGLTPDGPTEVEEPGGEDDEE